MTISPNRLTSKTTKFPSKVIVETELRFNIDRKIPDVTGQNDHFTCSSMYVSLTRHDIPRFGLVLGDDGKRFQTRSTEVVKLIDLLDEAKTRCKAALVERGRDAVWTDEQLQQTTKALGYGAVKLTVRVCAGQFVRTISLPEKMTGLRIETRLDSDLSWPEGTTDVHGTEGIEKEPGSHHRRFLLQQIGAIHETYFPNYQEFRMRVIHPIRAGTPIITSIRLTFREDEDGSKGKDEGQSPRDEGDEDLKKPYKEVLKSPFTRRIIKFSAPSHRMPTNLKIYDGSTDPDDHITHFVDAANQGEWEMPVWCRMFQQTLDGPGRGWFDRMPNGCIDSWADLRERFAERFALRRKCSKDPTEVLKIIRRAN
ncbi:reverse transcriptase domain-containing protein [Tanacetum coccineum]|uniref:Reverse transcriptase domain-containing protein n=1 Tax=Tanacetum coccineum TaxID=301880 RepID=A0ABQ5B5C6_9ASTR